jgi:hypothetical protein
MRCGVEGAGPSHHLTCLVAGLMKDHYRMGEISGPE